MVLNSMAYGVIAGILCYLLLNGIPFVLRKVSGDKLLPLDYELKEKWVIPPGGITPVWVYVLRLVLFIVKVLISKQKSKGSRLQKST